MKESNCFGLMPMPAALVAECLGFDVIKTSELNTYVYEYLKKWGLVSSIGRWGKGIWGEVPADLDEAIYYPSPLLEEAIQVFFGHQKQVSKPSPAWGDITTIAINLNHSPFGCQSSLNEFVITGLNDLGFSPVKGRMGAEGRYINASDGGVFPINNFIVQQLIKEFFLSAPNNDPRKYISDVSEKLGFSTKITRNIDFIDYLRSDYFFDLKKGMVREKKKNVLFAINARNIQTIEANFFSFQKSAKETKNFQSKHYLFI